MSPLRRFQASCSELASRHRAAAASRGVHYPAECCLYRRTEPVGLARSHPCLVVSDGPLWSSDRYRPPRSLRNRVHPLVDVALLQSSFLHRPARASRDLERLPWGLVPLHDISPRSPLTDGGPASVYVPPAAFRTLSTACSSSNLARLFRRAAMSRVLAPGVSSHDPAAPTRRRPLPSRRWRRRLPVARRQRTSRRPQGLAPNRGPQCPARFLGALVTRVPSCVFNSLGRRPGDLGSAVAPPPLATFTTRGCVSPAPLILSVSIDPRAVASVPRGPSRSSFLA